MAPLNPTEHRADVGVIVGRFQVHDLHDGHRELIESVLARHQKVIIFLGSIPGVLVTRNNPLDFQTRREMLHQHYRGLTILPIPDQPTDEGWSDDLDRRIREITEGLTVQLYGSRDGFIEHYKGQFPTVELAATKHISGTQVRQSVSNTVRQSPEFRRGVIYAAYNRHATSYQAVDALVVRFRGTITEQILLGRKATDPPDSWRLFGGFVDPRRDETLESAAARELNEEAGDISVHRPTDLPGQFPRRRLALPLGR